MREVRERKKMKSKRKETKWSIVYIISILSVFVTKFYIYICVFMSKKKKKAYNI